ncbi:MAG: AMP-binding protein [Legionellales bacterium]|nr:AMP-binding protein [Legionellales bacterium]
MLNDNTRIEEVFIRVSQQFKDKTILQVESEDDKRSWTYQELLTDCLLAKERLVHAGIKPGDRCIILGETHPHTIIAFLSVLMIKATAVLIDPSLPAKDTIELITRIDARAILTTQKLLSKLTHEISSDIAVLDLDQQLQDFAHFSSKVNPNKPTTQDCDQDVAFILFSSGTTGQYKGVLITHSAILNNMADSKKVFNYDHKLTAITFLPLFHIFCLGNWVIPSLLNVIKNTLIPRFDPSTLTSLLEQIRPSMIIVVPRFLSLFHRKIMSQIEKKSYFTRKIFFTLLAINKFTLKYFKLNLGRIFFNAIHQSFGGKITILLCGGAKLDDTIFSDFCAMGLPLYNGYGLTETCGGIFVNDQWHKGNNYIGRPFYTTEWRILTTSEEGSVGELAIRSPCLFKGYFRDEKATQEAFEEGWFKTGDLAFNDAKNCLHISGRIKEIIVTASGKKISPTHVEHYFNGIPLVNELAIVGIAEPNSFGETIHLAVVIENSGALAAVKPQIESEILARNNILPSHFRVQKIHFVNHIPKTSTQKIRRHELRKQLLAQSHLNTAEQNYELSPELQVIVSTLTKKLAELTGNPKSEMAIDRPLIELGIDSLIAMELVSFINEKFSQVITMSELIQLPHLLALAEGLNHQQFSSNALNTVTHKIDLEKITSKRSRLAWYSLRVFHSFSKCVWKMKLLGQENIPKTPFIICANHVSHLDPYWLLSALDQPTFELVHVLAKKEHWDHFLTRYAAQLLGGIAVDRDGDSDTAYYISRELIKRGNIMLIFPEGTRSKTGKLGRLKKGVAKLAIETQTPLLPITIHGGFEIFPPHKKMPRLLRDIYGNKFNLTLQIHKPIFPHTTHLDASSLAIISEQLQWVLNDSTDSSAQNNIQEI